MRIQDRMKHTVDFKNKGFKPNTRGHPVQDSFTTLEELLTELPEAISFNIEIKYPRLHEAVEAGVGPFGIEINTFIDRILDQIFRVSSRRTIILSSFSPEICILLAKKQDTYPVLFITNAGKLPMSDMEMRASSLQAAVRFSKRWNLTGIVFASETLVLCPRLVGYVKRSGLVCGSYGPLNNIPEHAKRDVNVMGGYDGWMARPWGSDRMGESPIIKADGGGENEKVWPQVKPTDVIKSSLESFRAAGHHYDASTLSSRIADIFASSANTYTEGWSMEGLWTIPVCDISNVVNNPDYIWSRKADILKPYGFNEKARWCGPICGMDKNTTVEFYKAANFKDDLIAPFLDDCSQQRDYEPGHTGKIEMPLWFTVGEMQMSFSLDFAARSATFTLPALSEVHYLSFELMSQSVALILNLVMVSIKNVWIDSVYHTQEDIDATYTLY
ncbi:Glycerophosphoryl diester phosphodiesterase [Penicillium griseofulvum]|uniref:Glycerophosphoryl diester phosphodiesterase n=1 Tax=Penicillium patulum TaxID=5078 RepID=A0A135L9Q1_PENPA|nr:Glycerophosphoryl diester phosphodiesterase [Penicillium griseofulvum]KXG45689.1 Glycerophosphoryl diester phosphodiesterase [Penicillium griseofulvum]